MKTKFFSLDHLESRYQDYCLFPSLSKASEQIMLTTNKAHNVFLAVINPAYNAVIPKQSRQYYADLLQLHLVRKGLL